MKTLSEIIDDAQDGLNPDYDDLRYAVVALSALIVFDFNALMQLAEREKAGKYNPAMFGIRYQAEHSFNRYKLALSMPPKQFVGTSHDMDTEGQREAFDNDSKI